MIIRLNRYSWPLVVPVGFALAIGVLMVYSASMALARDSYQDSLYVIKRQLVWLVAGAIVFVLAARLDYRRWRRLARPLLLGGVTLLLLVLIPGLGRSGGGARRWLQFGPIGLQPSELVKYILVIFLADILSRKQAVIHRFWEGFFPPLAVTGFLAALVLIQPDMGNAVCILTAGWILVCLAGGSWRHLLLSSLPVLPALAWLAISKPYRLRRLIAFADPWADARGSGYQIIQALTALGSGGWGGVGLGESRQKLLYLPAATTDFIFAIVGEELGFIGAALVVAAFLFLVFQGFRVAAAAEDLFGRFLAQGITLMLGLQAFVNFAVVSSLLPTKGLPLPFISQGGSNLLCSLLAAGVLVNIAGSISPAVSTEAPPAPGWLLALRLPFQEDKDEE